MSNYEHEVFDGSGENLESKNYFFGTVGAVLGAVIGSVPWAIALYFGWFVGWLGFVIGVCAKKGYELLGGKKGRFKIVVVCVATVLGVLVGNTAWDLIEFGQMISAGEIYGATYWDIPFLYLAWVENPEVMQSVLVDLAIGFVFAALGVRSVFKEMVNEIKTPQESSLEAEAAGVGSSPESEE